jgi:hypothetical protein
MDMASTLEVGDVVVVPQVRASHLVFVVHAEGGSDQLSYESRAEAQRTRSHTRDIEVSAPGMATALNWDSCCLGASDNEPGLASVQR